MGEQAIKLLGIDIDGTMIRSDGSLSPRVKAALHAATDAGIQVVPATGRPVVVAADVIEALDLPHYWVFANGAITRHLGRDELVRGFWMDHTVAAQLITKVRAGLPNVGVALEFETNVIFEAEFDQVVPVAPPGDPVADALDYLHLDTPGYERIQKVLLYDVTVDLGELFDNVTSTVDADEAVVTYSGLPFLELSARQVTKATALAPLAADLGIEPSEVAVFGDNYNDLAMFAWAGFGYAMENATQEVKDIATEVIGSNDEDAVAHKVEAILRAQEANAGT